MKSNIQESGKCNGFPLRYNSKTFYDEFIVYGVCESLKIKQRVGGRNKIRGRESKIHKH